MRREAAKATIGEFVASPDAGVLVFSGNWGVGKSRLCDEAVELTAQETGCPRLASRVSLLGLTSLSELRLAIYSSLRRTRIGGRRSLSHIIFDASLMKVLDVLRRFVRFFRLVPQLRFVDAETASYHLMATLRDSLIILDDIERRADKLSLDEIIALAVSLRDDRQCSVIFIINDGALPKDDKVKLQNSLDKFANHRLALAPTPQENVDLIMDNEGDGPIREACISIGITNLRILMRIRSMYNRVLGEVGPLRDGTREELGKCVALMVFAEYGENRELKQWVKSEYTRHLYGVGSRDLNDDEKEAVATLERLGWGSSSPLSYAVLAYLEAGGGLSSIVEEVVALDHKVQSPRSRLWQAWQLYHHSFEDNEGQIVSLIMEAFERELASIRHEDLDATYRLLRDLGREDEARHILDQYVNQNDRSREYYDLRNDPYASDIRSPDVRDALNKKFASLPDERDPSVVLMEGAYTEDNAKLLASIPIDELVQIFRRGGKELTGAAKYAVEFPDHWPEGAKFRENAKAALSVLAKESRLNSLRARRYGVAP